MSSTISTTVIAASHESPMPTPTGHTATQTPTRGRPGDWRTWAAAAAGRSVYACLALPVCLVGLVAASLGGARRVSRVQRELARRFLGVAAPSPASPRRRGSLRVFGHCLATVPANLLAFALIAPVWALFLTRGVLYPVFGANNLEQSWGGPTLAGAWLVHFIQGPPLIFVMTLVLGPVSRFQARQARLSRLSAR